MTTDKSLTDDVFIVAFTKDWGDVPTCTTHILREMAKTIPVLWVCSIGTRKPQAASIKDWKRILFRLVGAFRLAALKALNLRVLRPLLIPKAESVLSQRLNRFLFRLYLWREIPASFKGTIEYWCFVPNAVDLIPSGSTGKMASRIIYYCADDWTQFHNLDGAWMAAKEKALVQRAKVIFATSKYLVEKFKALCADRAHGAPSVIYMPHGVDYAAFSSALGEQGALPPDVDNIPKPIIGFYGNLHAWVDFDLLARLAAVRPQWSFVLIGEIYEDVSQLRRFPNIYLLGRREHDVLPAFCRAFDVAIIPYDLAHERMVSVNPVKAKELLAAGVPIVASRIPELSSYGDAVQLCDSDEAWVKAIEHQLRLTKADRMALSKSVMTEGWDRKVLEIRRAVD